MTPIVATLTFPVTPALNGNKLICEAVEGLDKCDCRVKTIWFKFMQFSPGGNVDLALVVSAHTDHPLDGATVDEQELWLLEQLDGNEALPDCQINID